MCTMCKAGILQCYQCSAHQLYTCMQALHRNVHACNVLVHTTARQGRTICEAEQPLDEAAGAGVAEGRALALGHTRLAAIAPQATQPGRGRRARRRRRQPRNLPWDLRQRRAPRSGNWWQRRAPWHWQAPQSTRHARPPGSARHARPPRSSRPSWPARAAWRRDPLEATSKALGVAKLAAGDIGRLLHALDLHDATERPCMNA